MQHASYRADGIPEVKVTVSCGWVQPWSSDKRWTGTATYNVTVAETDPFSVLVDKLREAAGPAAKINKLFAVDPKTGQKYDLFPNKSVRENILTSTGGILELRFPNSMA